jgi:hypothetical protein
MTVVRVLETYKLDYWVYRWLDGTKKALQREEILLFSEERLRIGTGGGIL